ncbi:uncharacterized protein BDZ99DRAFT_424033 [Mytilinidion resinicola]|uniref:R3H-associated N-terminal domain-containing protein n=1 Tax=Mytilinidion resinicola TaxID=574789 RepID=A0A6A6YA22_9PEZI|nr:uncharacterized protein BDZ99DRAFT_424033 [Mytilinidion resinicola]KAF2805672.1 hypothetical protein BDZ99DRAFT_424033 [Mytilinidion resinicola]
MAIHPAASAPHSQAPATAQAPIDIEAWTEQATAALSSVTISATHSVPGTSVSLQIPLDDHPVSHDASAAEAVRAGYVKRRAPIRRDSMKSREALLKGKEGSRRRQRWENDRLLSNPHAVPPQPHDWEIRPTYPVRTVPYYLAPLWDTTFAAASSTRKAKASAAKQTPKGADNAGKVPKELREKLKRARGAKSLLENLETEVRRFVAGWEDREKTRLEREAKEGIPLEPDSEDEEIVFVGRNGMMNDMRSPRTSGEFERREMLLFESPADDHGASFGRFLVHHIGSYYGLRTWSVTTGNPARREAYIGLKDGKLKSGQKLSTHSALPRPLYGLV